MNIKLRRSVLYVSGSNQRTLEKASGLPADCLIVDSEIAAANTAFGPSTGEVTQARESAKAWNEASQQGKGICVANSQLV